jgi:hypothetical protein
MSPSTCKVKYKQIGIAVQLVGACVFLANAILWTNPFMRYGFIFMSVANIVLVCMDVCELKSMKTEVQTTESGQG